MDKDFSLQIIQFDINYRNIITNQFFINFYILNF